MLGFENWGAPTHQPAMKALPAGRDPVMTLCECHEEVRPSLLHLATHRPVALLALVPRPLVLFTAGALSGAIAKTLTAPLDRVKILLQVKGGMQGGTLGAAAAEGNLVKAMAAIWQQEGALGYWKGNLPQVLKVVPYSAAQLYSYEVFKTVFRGKEEKLSVPRRLAAGACAGMFATLVSARAWGVGGGFARSRARSHLVRPLSCVAPAAQNPRRQRGRPPCPVARLVGRPWRRVGLSHHPRRRRSPATRALRTTPTPPKKNTHPRPSLAADVPAGHAAAAHGG